MATIALTPGRVPPHDLDAEVSVLGSILLDPLSIAKVLQFLHPEDFYRENNGQVYRAALDLFAAGEPIDNVTLAAQLQTLGMLDRVGGRAALASMQSAVPTSANIEYYGRIIKEKAYKRRLISAGANIAGFGYDDGVEAEAAINQAQSLVFGVADDRDQRELSKLYDLLGPAMERISLQMESGQGVVGVPSGFHDLDRMTGGFKDSDLIIVAGRPSMGKCVRSNSLIDDPATGERTTIEDAVRRQMPSVFGFGWDGLIEAQEVHAWVDSGIKPCFKVTTRTGRSVEVTGHHPFLTTKGWQPLHDIAIGTRIGVPRWVRCFGDDQSMQMGKVRLLAYFIAEGGLTGTTPGFTNTDPEILADFHLLIASHFPSLKVRQNAISYFPSGPRGGRPNPLTTWLKELGMMGKLAAEKRFPDSVWRWDRDRLREFIKVLMSCDGTVYSMTGYPRIEFAVASEGLAQDMHHALVRFGIVAKLWKKKDRCWRVEITEPVSVRRYQTQIGWIGEKSRRFTTELPNRRSNVGHLSKEIWSDVRFSADRRGMTLLELARRAGEPHSEERGFNPHTSRGLPSHRLAAYADVLNDVALRQIASDDIYWDEVVSIEATGEHQVYDLTVPDTNNFIAQDILVHNTSFALNVGLHAALENKKSIAIFSLEMSKEQLTERLLTEQAQIDAQRLHRGLLSEAEFDRVSNALGPLGEASIYIDDTPVMDELTLQLKARQAKMRHGIDMIIVDYLQLMHGRSRGDDNRVQEVSSISRALKGLARELRIPVLAISQLSRAPEQRPDKRPILSDLRESGCLSGDTPIYLPDTGAYVPIRELAGKSGFRVLALDEKWWRMTPKTVTNAFATGTKPVFKMTTKLGRRIRATSNHKFRTIEGWKRLDELHPGDRIALPRVLQGPEKDTMSYEELGLLGHLIGDGCTLPTHAIQYTTVDPSLAELVANLATQVFGDRVRPRIHPERSWIQVCLPPTQHLTHGVHNPIRVWLEGLGAFGFRSHEKRVPAKVFSQSALGIAVFLRHLWATDGCVHLSHGVSHYANVYYASSSAGLAQDVQCLLLRLGINAKLTRHSQPGKGRDQYHVSVSGQHEILAFLEIVGVLGAEKTEHKAAILEYLSAREPNTNRDVIPAAAWRLHAVPAMQMAGITTRAMQAGMESRYSGTGIFDQNLSRDRAKRLAGVVKSSDLELLAISDVYWDRIVGIEPAGVEEVYDLTVDNLHSFVAGNVIAHNSIEQDSDLVMFLFRPEYYKSDERPGIAEVIVSKHRNGPTGMIELKFRRDHTRFYNLETRRPEPGTE
jgi:replicative DNA helicase